MNYRLLKEWREITGKIARAKSRVANHFRPLVFEKSNEYMREYIPPVNTRRLQRRVIRYSILRKELEEKLFV